MGSHPRAVIVLAIVLLLLGASSAQTPSFCTILNAFISSPSLPDGFVGSDLTDVSFVAKNCAGSTMSFDTTSPTTVAATFLPAGLSLKDATIKRTVSASVTADEMVTFEVSLTLSANVVGTYLGAPLSTAIVATMTQSAAALPSAAAGSFPSAWVGTLSTPTPTKLSFQDADLFDEVNPAILTVSDAAVSPSLLKTSEFVSTLAADFNINLGGLTISHPSLVYRSVRGAFIGGVNIIDAESSARSGTVPGATEAGILVQQTVSCADSFCPEAMGPVLKAVVDEAALTLCEEDSMSTIMLRSTRVIDMFVTPSNVAFRSASATTEALYQCGDNGFVGLQLRVTNSWQPWPVVAFMEDNTTASYLAKSNSPWLGGYMWGSLKGENGTSYSFGRSDIFGIHGGGRLMLDVPLVKPAVGPFITQLHDHLNTEVAVADAAIDAADADWSKTLDSYVASSINPTWNGFLQYYTDKYPGFFKITFGPAAVCPGSPLPCGATSPVMDFALTMPAVAIPKADPYMKTFDKVIAAFVAQINAQYSTSVSPASVANSTGASASLFVSYIHRVRIAGNPAPTGTFKANTTIVSDDLVPQLFTAASLVATYPATVGLFGALNVTLVNSTSGSNATLVRARINAPLSSSIGSMVSWDSNNKLVSDLRVAPLSSFQEPLSKAAGQLGNLEFFYTIAPLSLNPSAVGNTTYMQLITSIYAALPALQSVSSQTAAVTLEQLANSAVGSSASSFFAARVSVQSVSSMEIDMRYSTLQMITVKSSQLLGRVDVSELLIPTVVQTRLLIQMKTDGSEPTVVFELKAAANYSDFTLPISFSMNSAVTTSSSVGISLALPDGASYMNMQLTAKTDLNATVRLEFETEKLGDQSSFPSFKIYGEEQVQSDPARVFGDIQNLFLLPEANLGGALNATFYPWGDSFSQHMDYADIINKQLPWLLGPVFTPSSPAQSGEICLADIPTSLTGNFTVNAHPAAACTMSLSTASYQSVVDSLNAGLRVCGLSTYLMASSASVGSEGCVRLGLVPTTPGVLYQFAIESNLWNSTWTLMPFVEFTSWPELPIAVTAVLPQATVSPVRIFTAPSSAFPDLVNTNLRPVFPKLTVAEYSVSIAYDTEVSGVNTATTATTADAFYMDLANGVGEGSIAMTFGAKVRSVMDLPVVASCVSTNFSDSSIDMTSTAVPAAPANVLSLSVVAFIRSPGNVELVTWEGQLTLTSDEALVTALENAVAEQPAGTWLAGLLNATRFPGDALLGIPDQVRVCINQRQLEGDADTWVIPLEIAVINDDSPFFATQSLVSPNSINMAVANFSLSASLDATAEATNTTVGVVQFSTYTPVVGTSTIHLSVNSDTQDDGPGFKGIGKLSSAAGRGSTLVEAYNVRVDTALSWSVKDIALIVDNDGIGNSEATLAINQVRKMINSTEVLNQVADISLRPTYSNPAVARLAKMPANPFCDGISTVLRLSEAVADTDIASMTWPFMRFSAAPLFGQTIKAMAGTLASRVCKTKGLTIPSFCSLIQDAAGFQMCAGSSIDFTALVVLLQFEATPVATRAPFVYDFEAFGHDLNSNATKAIGMDANFDLLASPKGTIELFMDLIDDSAPRPEFILGDNTGFELTVETDFGGDLSARLGPARVSFTGASGGLDLTMSVDLTGSFQRRGPAVAGTRVVFVTEEPMPNRKLAVRQDEPGLQAEITLTGSAEFSATMMKGMQQYCNINTYVPDLAAFFDEGISEDATSCEAAGGGADGGDGGVGGAIDDAVDSTSPLEFWSDIGMIQNVFIGTLRDFVMRILGPKLGGLIFPLIEDIATYLMEPVMNVISPQHMNAMSSEWQGTITKVRRSPMKGAGKTVKPGGMTGTSMTGMTGMTMNKRDSILAPRQGKTAKTAGMGKVAKTGMTGMKVAKTAGMTMSGMGMGMGMGQSTSSQINEFLRGLLPYLFTKLLCRVFGDYLRTCPPVPDTNAPVKSWLLPFYYEKVIPIAHTRFALGDHGWADLRFDCSINLVLSGAFDLELTYSEADGLDLKFPSEDVLEVEAKFVTVPGCELAGKLLVVGFQFMPTGVFGAKLTVKKGFKVDVSILASLMGGADIGFAGPIAKAITGDPDAITALPHVHAFISLSWSWSISKPALTTPSFSFEDPQLCLGTLLNRIVGGLAKQVKKIIDPLAPIIGPDGILLRKIAVAKYIIGRETNLLEILSWVAEYFCSIDECTMAGVVDAIKVAAEVYRYADALASMADLDPNGCGVVQLIQNFNLDFLKPTPFPEWQLGDPTIQPIGGKRGKGGKGGGDIVFSNPKMQEKMSEFYDHFDAVTKGDFAFNLDIMDEPITKLITVLLGGRVPVCSFTLPEFTISVGASWSFLVWVWPPIYIVIGLSAGITVDIGKIALLSDGIINAISTGNVGQLVSGLAMPTKKPNGQPHYPLRAFLKVAAGAEVSIFIFTAGVQVWLKIEGAMGFSSVNGDGWITFAEIWNLIKFNNYNIIAAFDKELTVTAGVYLYIQACIPLVFKKICWTIIDLDLKWTLWKETWKGNKPPPIADAGGRVQLGGVKKRKARDAILPQVELNPNSATGGRATAYSNDPLSTFPPIDRDTPTNPVAFDGAAEGEFNLYLHGVTQPVVAPSGQPFVMQMDTRSYNMPTHDIKPTFVSPAISIQDCSLLNYDTLPPLTTVVYTDGAPCQSVHNSVSSASFVVKGTPDGYSGKPITVKDAAMGVDFNVPTTVVRIASNKIFGAPDVNVNVPPPVPFLTITGHPSDPTTYTILDSAEGSLLRLTGGTGSDTFITRLSDNKGTVTIDGAGQGMYANWMKFTVDADAGNNVTLSPFVSTQQHMVTNATYTVHHSNTPRRSYNVNAVSNEKLYVQVSSMETGGTVDIYTRGAVGAVISHELLSCDDQSELRVYVSGPGQHLVIIGDGSNTLANFGQCTIRVTATSEAGQDARIILNQGEDPVSMEHKFSTNMYAVQGIDTNYLLSVAHTGIDMIILNAGLAARVQHLNGTFGTETVIHFPDNLTEPGDQENSAVIWAWTNAIIVNGSFSNVTVGRPESPSYSVDPFIDAKAVLAINAQVPDTQVLLVSGQDQNVPAPPQRFMIGNRCFDPLDGTLTKAPKLVTAPTATMLNEMLTYNGFDPSVDYTVCHVAYLGPVHFVVRTGSAPDYFLASTPGAPVNFSFAGGDDISIWSYAEEGAYFNADMGEGRDKLILGLPVMAPINAILGAEMQVDSVDIYPTTMPNPNIATDPLTRIATVASIGPSGETLTLYDYRAPYDLAHIRQGPPGAAITYADLAPRDGVVYINAGTPGEVLKVDLQTGQSYELLSCGQDTTVVLDPGSTDPEVPPAANFQITIRLPTYTQSCYILVPAIASSESLINVYYAATPTPNSPNFPASVTEMSAFPGTVWTTFGGTRIQSTYIDHLYLSYPVKVNLTVDGTAGADISISAPQGSWVMSGDSRFAGNALLVGPSLVVSAPAMNSGNLIVTADALSVSIASPGTSATVYESGAVSFNPPVTPVAVFSPWFNGQLGSAGLSGALSTETNVFISNSAEIIFISPSVTSANTGAAIVPNGLFKVVGGELLLTEAAALTSVAISEIEMTVNTVASELYRVQVDGGHSATVTSSFTETSTLSVQCAGTRLPSRWVFAGIATSTFDFVTSACAGSLVSQSPLPVVSFVQPSSTVVLTSTLPVDAAPFNLAVDVNGDNSAYTMNFVVDGGASPRAHSVALFAANSTLTTSMTVTGVGAVPASTAVLTAASTTATGALSTTFGVVSASALNVSAIGSLSVDSVLLNVTGDILPFDLRLNTLGAPGAKFTYLVSSAAGAAGAVNVSASALINALDMNLGVTGVAVPPAISLVGSINSPGVAISVSGDARMVDINALASATAPSSVAVNYDLFNDVGASLATNLTATTNDQALSIGLTGDKVTGASAVSFGGNMDINTMNLTIVGDISPLAIGMNVTGLASTIGVSVNIIDDSSAPLLLTINGDNSVFDGFFNFTGDQQSGQTDSSLLGLSGMVGINSLCVNAVGDFAPLNIDLDLVDAEPSGTFKLYLSDTSAAPVARTNVTFKVDLTTVDAALTMHGLRTGATEMGVVGTMHVTDVNIDVSGDMSSLLNDLHLLSDEATADIEVSIDQDGPRDVNITTTIVTPTPMDLALQLIGQSFGQQITYLGTLGQRNLNVDITGMTNTNIAVSSVDDRLAISADGQSSRRPVDIDILGKILPLTLKLDMSDDNVNLGVASTNNNTVTMQVLVPDPATPGLYWNLMGYNALLDTTFQVLGASDRSPIVNIGGSLTPYDARLKVFGDVSMLSSILQVESASARFGVDVGVIGADNNRDVNVTVDNLFESSVSLELSVVGSQGSRSQLIGVQGTIGERTLNVALKGATPLLLSLLSREDELNFLANTSRQSRARQSASPDLTVAVSGSILPLELTVGLENGDDISMGIVSPANHTLMVAVAVPDQTSPGLTYLLAGDNRNISYALSVLKSTTRKARFNVDGSLAPIDTILHVYGDIGSINATHHIDTAAPATGLFGLDLGVDGPAAGSRNVNVTVTASEAAETKLDVSLVGQSSQTVSVVGNMDQRKLNVNVNGVTPMLVSFVSRDSDLALNVDSDSYATGRDTLLGVAAEILPMEFTMTVTGDALDLGLVGSSASTSTVNVTLVSDDPARALSSVLFGQNSALDIAVNVAAATSGNPTVAITGGYTTQRSSLNVTGGGVSQLSVDLDVLGDAGVQSAFDLAVAPLAATQRVISVQSQPITADTDGHRFLALDLALISAKTFDLKVVDASNTLLMDTDTVVPTVFVGGTAMMLLNNTDEKSSILFPGRRLVPDWPRDAFRPMLNSRGDDCLQPEPDCTREGWIRTAVTDTATCPNRTCTRTGVILTTPFDVQCPAFGKFPRDEYTILVNPTDAPIKSPYSKWTFYFVVVVLAFCWLVPLAIWTVFGYLYWHLWAEFVICAMILFAQPHTHPLALSMIQNFNYGVSTAFLFNCWDLRNLSILSWTAIAACAVIIALWTIEKLGNPRYKWVIKGAIIGQRFFGGWLFFFVAPIALANIWTSGVAIGTRLFFALALVAVHVLHRILVRLTRKDKALHPTLLVTIPVAAFAPLVLVGWSFGLGSADVSFAIALACVLIINIPHFIKSWFWKQTGEPQWPWVPAVTIANVIFGLVWVALVYARGPSAAVITFVLLWAVTAVAGTVVGRVMAYLNGKGQRVHSLRHPVENMRSPLLKTDADPSL